MAHKLSIRPQADADLVAFAEYIAKDNIDAALRLLDAARATLEFLSVVPFAGVACGSFFKSPKARNLRLWRIKSFPNHQILYSVSDDTVTIVRIIHAAQDKREIITSI